MRSTYMYSMNFTCKQTNEQRCFRWDFIPLFNRDFDNSSCCPITVG